ncbi:MAG: 50S ribosomal protein L3 [Leptospiraceae bacterium]|nr:50S ribosomal protein L3 [Leptospiraceae bacterium]MCP5496639.1 50S ribosomal protein L3 [Leptospiraceae bacterium]
MTKGLIGKKIGMSQVYSEDGRLIPVTILEIGPCSVSQVRTKEKDGYTAVQLAYGDVKESKLSKAEFSHLSSKSISPKRYLQEFALEGEGLPEEGSLLKITDIFKTKDVVKVSAISKGKGFQGVIKRHGFHGGPGKHGSRNHRHPGSIGACSTPSRVFKGVKLPGRMGGGKATIINLKIIKILEKENILMVSGSVPGNAKGILTIEKI